MQKLLIATMAAALMTACGGSSNDTTTACTPTGSYTYTGQVTAPSGWCAANLAGADSGSVTVAYDATAKTFSWTDSGDSYTGTLNTGTCTANLTKTQSVAYDATHTLTATDIIAVQFTATGFTATSSGNVSIAPSDVSGLPCTVSETVTGTKH